MAPPFAENDEEEEADTLDDEQQVIISVCSIGIFARYLLVRLHR